MRNIICTWFLMCLWGDDSLSESAFLEHFCTNSKWFHLLCIFSTLTGCCQTTCTFQGPSYLCVFPTLQLAGENNCSQDFEQGEPFFHQLYLVKFQYHSSGFPWKQKLVKHIFEESEIQQRDSNINWKQNRKTYLFFPWSCCADKELWCNFTGWP